MKKFTPCKRATNSAMYPSLVIRNKFEVVQTNPYQRTYFILDSTPCFSLYCFITTRLDSNKWIFVFKQITARFLKFVAWSRNIFFFSCSNLMTTLEITPNSLFSSALWLHLSKLHLVGYLKCSLCSSFLFSKPVAVLLFINNSHLLSSTWEKYAKSSPADLLIYCIERARTLFPTDMC